MIGFPVDTHSVLEAQAVPIPGLYSRPAKFQKWIGV